MKLNGIQSISFVCIYFLPILSLAVAEKPKLEFPEIPGARVTIPYVELKSLWEAARIGQTKKKIADDPPIESIVLSAEYELQYGENRTELVAAYEVHSLVEQWQKIPLLGSDTRLIESTSEGAEIISADDCYQLLVKGKGLYKAQLSFSFESINHWDQQAQLKTGAANIKRLTAKGWPDNLNLIVNGTPPTIEKDGSKIWYLAGRDDRKNGIPIKVVKANELEKPGPPLPSEWKIQSEVFIKYRDGRLFYECLLYGQTDNGSGMSMDLLLPSNATNLTVIGEDLAKHSLVPTKNGERYLHIDWKSRDVLDRKINLRYAVPQSPLSKIWTLVAPRVEKPENTNSLIAIESIEGLEFDGEKLLEASQTPRFSKWLKDQVGNENALILSGSSIYSLETTWLPRMETAEATISKAEYKTRIVSDGSMLVHANVYLQHQSPLTWKVTLPRYEQFLSCEINSQSARPIKRGGSEIEFSIPATDKRASLVNFSFSTKVEAFDPISGTNEIALPKTDLFIYDLNWELSFPLQYEVEIQGNLEMDRGNSSIPSGTIILKKELVRNEVPAIEIHYQHRDLSDK